MSHRVAIAALILATSAAADSFNQRSPGVVSCGDQNGDGVSDLLLASRDEMRPGVVWLISGKDGQVLHVFTGEPGVVGFGDHIDSLGDLDGDGKPEFVISTSGFRQVPLPHGFRRVERGRMRCECLSSRDFSRILDFSSPGRLCVVHDRSAGDKKRIAFLDAQGVNALALEFRALDDGHVLKEVPAPKGWAFGNSVQSLGDLNGDRVDDVGITIEELHRPRDSSGPVLITFCALSGVDGAELWRRSKSAEGASGWTMIAPPVDLDRDGVPDVLLGAESRWVSALSGKTGKQLYEVPALYASGNLDGFASSLVCTGDVDGDGISDWVVSANEEIGKPFFDEGYVWVCSGKDGKSLREVARDDVNGYDVCSLGDVDGDGITDLGLLVQSAKARWTEAFDPELRVVSWKDGRVIWKTTTRALRSTREDLAPRPEPAADTEKPLQPR